MPKLPTMPLSMNTRGINKKLAGVFKLYILIKYLAIFFYTPKVSTFQSKLISLNKLPDPGVM